MSEAEAQTLAHPESGAEASPDNPAETPAEPCDETRAPTPETSDKTRDGSHVEPHVVINDDDNENNDEAPAATPAHPPGEPNPHQAPAAALAPPASGSAPAEEENRSSDTSQETPPLTEAHPSEHPDDDEEDDFQEGSNKTQRKRLRKKERTRKPPPKPTLSDIGPRVFAEFPVLLKDTGKGVARLSMYHPWYEPLKKIVGARLADDVIVERLKSGAYMVHCKDATIQRKLSIQNLIGGATVTCTIPQPTTTGVIYNIPLGPHHLERLQAVIPDATRVERLKNKDGDPTKAVKITFRAAILPKTVHLGTTVTPVVPFSAPVRRCTHCQRLGHTKQQCRAKKAVCSQCGGTDHLRPACANPRKCVNCGGEHSAAYAKCPALGVHNAANKIRAEKYIPYSEALRRAKAPPPPTHQEPQGRKTKFDQEFWESQHPTPPPQTKTYAAAARIRDQQAAPSQNRSEQPRQPVPPNQPLSTIARSHPRPRIELDGARAIGIPTHVPPPPPPPPPTTPTRRTLPPLPSTPKTPKRPRLEGHASKANPAPAQPTQPTESDPIPDGDPDSPESVWGPAELVTFVENVITRLARAMSTGDQQAVIQIFSEWLSLVCTGKPLPIVNLCNLPQ
nr:hypothetical protein BaRGS_003666 [Batillaria attramentaria]